MPGLAWGLRKGQDSIPTTEGPQAKEKADLFAVLDQALHVG